MKGVILSRCPNAALVDISHALPPLSVLAAAYAVAQSWAFFPAGAVHLVVVDPGVGTSRRALVVQTENHFFVAPDNGVLSLVLDGRAYQAVEITNHPQLTYPASQTFHGRDVFAPVAAELASGRVAIHQFGPSIDKLESGGIQFREQLTGRDSTGITLSVDRFGNVITNFSAYVHASLPVADFFISVERESVDRFYPTFGAAPRNVLFAYFGSAGFIEIGMNGSSAADQLGIAPGDELTLRYR